jgi:DNA-binding MarR family transcriptional regulator
VIEETGLSMTQCKALLELGGLGGDAQAWQVSDLAELFGTSVPSMSRAVDALVRAKLATRVEDPDDRRVKRLALTAKGQRLADRIISARLAGLEEFTGSLEDEERQKLESALDALLERPEIADIYANYERRVSR